MGQLADRSRLDVREATAGGGPCTGRLVPGALTFVFAEGLVIQTGVIHGTGLAFLGTELRVVAPRCTCRPGWSSGGATAEALAACQ